jgi:hypothetical protein
MYNLKWLFKLSIFNGNVSVFLYSEIENFKFLFHFKITSKDSINASFIFILQKILILKIYVIYAPNRPKQSALCVHFGIIEHKHK